VYTCLRTLIPKSTHPHFRPNAAQFATLRVRLNNCNAVIAYICSHFGSNAWPHHYTNTVVALFLFFKRMADDASAEELEKASRPPAGKEKSGSRHLVSHTGKNFKAEP
jgi:hypothetical protein